MTLAKPVHRLTEIEYLDLERSHESKNEFFDGTMFVPALREYLLVSQKEPRIEQFVRQENEQWLLREAAGWEATLALPSLEIKISLAEVFAGVEFAPAPIRARTPLRH